MAKIFISYRRDDAAGYAGRLHEALEERFGERHVFRDVDTLEPGRDFIEAIERRLRECRVFLALIGREWLESRDGAGRRRLDQPHDFVRLEIVSALARPDVLVIPVLIEGASMPDPESVPLDIRPLTRRHAMHLRDDAWDHDVDRLVDAIGKAASSGPQGVRGDRRSAPTPRVAWRATMIAMGAVAAIVVAFLAGRALDVPATTDSTITTTNPRPAADSTAPPVAAGVRGQSYGVAIPALAEVAHSRLIYTVLSATVVPTGNSTSELRLRFRFSNERSYAANVWDASFRLLTGVRCWRRQAG